jgi:tetratricopeptide (TPR) repeat protein
MMRGYAIVRTAVTGAAAGLVLLFTTMAVVAQDVGGEVGGGAGIFRAKNPETKKNPKTLGPSTTKPSNRPTSTRPKGPTVAEKIEDLLDKGNNARDARNFSEAEQAYQDVFKLKARDARAAYGLGNVYSDQQRWEDAEAAYRNAVQWAPTNADAHVALSVILVQPRAGAENAKRLGEAESFARRSVQIDPKNAVGWDRLGVALQARNILNSETEHSYRRAIELDPQFAVAYAHLARLLNRMSKGAEAVPLYEQASQLAKDPATLNLIAESLQAEQLWQASEPVLKRALELDARNPTSLVLMGRHLILSQRFEEAETFLKKATEVSPRSFQSFNLLGRAYLGLHRFNDAETAYETAATLVAAGDRKQLAGAFGFEGVGDGFMDARRRSDAARVYQRALELDPGNAKITTKLAKARSN